VKQPMAFINKAGPLAIMSPIYFLIQNEILRFHLSFFLFWVWVCIFLNFGFELFSMTYNKAAME
jgi:hypothetical protein